ncbi:MAG TPA: hypothetical protein VK619_10285 [Pyrinomonadaceae bacterium]|nr:hypothetical protein [Pyrinomonadaceae bacterium]
MGRTRRTSSILVKAQVRLNNLKTISPTLDLGGGLTVIAFEQKINEAQSALDDYNQTVASLDEKANTLDAIEKQTSEMSSRMLAGVGARHGKNSSEYETAGGVRTEEIKRPARKSKPDSAKQA